MRLRKLPVFALAALAACDDATAPGADRLTMDEIADLSTAMVEADFTMTGDLGASDQIGTAEVSTADAPITATTEFTHTRTCPVGGRIVVEGIRERTFDRETRSGTMDFSLTKTHENCARTVRNVTITLNGAPNVQVDAHHAWQNGAPVGLQTLSMVGAIDWATDDGREGTCTIDIQATFDPELRTRTVFGQACDRTFERKTTWRGGHR